jgi:rubrerythrin
MDPSFSVFDVLRIAEEVEYKAAKFYLRTAKRFADPERRSVCYDLASWRVRHRQAWGRIRREYSERTGEFGRLDPDNFISSNPQVMAALPWFGADAESGSRFSGEQSAQQIVRDARRRANGVLIFYQGLKGFAADLGSSMMVDNMIAEEGRHIRFLTQSLDRMQPPPTTPVDFGAFCAPV